MLQKCCDVHGARLCIHKRIQGGVHHYLVRVSEHIHKVGACSCVSVIHAVLIYSIQGIKESVRCEGTHQCASQLSNHHLSEQPSTLGITAPMPRQGVLRHLLHPETHSELPMYRLACKSSAWRQRSAERRPSCTTSNGNDRQSMPSYWQNPGIVWPCMSLMLVS